MEAAEKERLVRQHTPLIWSIVKRFTGRGVDPEDLFQLGAIGLIKAIEGYDEGYGTQFSTYAVPKIMGEIKRFLRDDGTIKISRVIKERSYAIERASARLREKNGREPVISEIAAETGFEPEDVAVCMQAPTTVTSLDEPLGDEGGSLLDLKGGEGYEDRLVENMGLFDAISRLGDDERRVVALRFFRDMTQQKTADILGMSQVKVSRIERRAVGRLRELIGE